MDINSLISSYAENNNLSASEVAERIKNIASNDMLYEKSIFDYGEDASLEELTNYITSERGSSDDIEQLENDISLLFDVLDTNSDGTLSDDELSLFERTSGSNKGNVDAFGIWNQLLNVDTSSVSTSSNSSTSADTADTTTSATTEADFSDKAEARNYVRSLVMSDNVKYDTAAEIISALYEDGTISENQAYQLRQAFTTYTDDDQAKIDNMVKYNGMTEKEAIEYLTGKGWISPDDSALYEEFSVSTDTATDFATGTTETDTTDTADTTDSATGTTETDTADTTDTTDSATGTTETDNTDIADTTNTTDTTDTADTSTATETEPEKTVISDEVALEYCKILYEATSAHLGTDESAVNKVFNNTEITSADWVKIINMYQKTYGMSLVTSIDKDFSDSNEVEYQTTIVNALLEEAKNGSEDAIKALSESIYGATAGMDGTADKFLEILFNNIDNETLYQVYKSYSDYTGSDLNNDIKEDHQYWLFGWHTTSTGKAYLEKISDAILACG